MRNTNNLGLVLYDASDKMNITGSENSLNHNMELLDAELVKKMAAPENGTTGQVLTKTEGGFAWQDAPASENSNWINDEATEVGSTWSSKKIAQEVEGKLNKETFDKVFYIVDASANLYEHQDAGWLEYASLLSSGGIDVNESSAARQGTCVTPLIPIDGGKTYTISPKIAIDDIAAANRARTYSENGTALPVMDFILNNDGSVTFTTPEYSVGIRFTTYKTVIGYSLEEMINKFKNEFMLVEGTSAPESYIPHIPAKNTLKNIEIPDKSVTAAKVAEGSFLPMKGKRIANFGDSIFGNARPPQDISTMLAARTGATVYNCAFGGCRMGQHVGHWDAFSMYQLAAAIANNDYSVQDEAITYEDRTSYAEEPLAVIKSIDFATLDILTIAYGTNDFTGNNPIDNAENPLDTTTICGALRYSIETLLTAYPQLRIYVLLPTYRYWLDENGAFVKDSDTYTNGLGKTLSDYSQALAGVAKAYKLPIIDNYHELGVNKLNREVYIADGAHHNQAGRELLADHIAHALW